MAKEYGFIGTNAADNLIADIKPDLKVGGGVIAHDETEAVYERGTVLARNPEDNKLYILGADSPEGLVADLIVKAEYQLKEEDIQALRQRGIVVSASMQVDNKPEN